MAELAPITSQDHRAVAHFMAAFPGDRRGDRFWEERVKWWWEQNPACTPDTPKGWLLKDQGRIKGFVGNIPTLFLLQGSPVTVVNATGWKVLDEYRQESMKIWFALMGDASKTILFCTTPNDIAKEIIEGLKFRLTPMPPAQTNLYLNFKRPLQIQLGKNPVSSALAGIFNAWQRGRLARRGFPPGISVQPLDQAGPEFDELWKRTQSQFQNTNVRTSEVLNWLCSGPSRLSKVLLGAYQDRRLVGFAVLRPIGEPGDLGLQCLDLWHDPAMPLAVEGLFQGALEYARDKSFDVLVFPHFSRDLAQRLEKWGLGRAKNIPHCHYFRAKKAASQALFQGRTYLVGLQGDVGL